MGCRDKKCVAFDHWASREDLLRTLQASCSFAWDGVEISGEKYWDGGMGKDAKLLMTDADLNDPSAMTVTVFPLSGLRGATIAPLSRDVVSLPTRYGDVSLSNLVRMWDVSAPRGSSSMEAY